MLLTETVASICCVSDVMPIVTTGKGDKHNETKRIRDNFQVPLKEYNNARINILDLAQNFNITEAQTQFRRTDLSVQHLWQYEVLDDR